MDRFITLYKKYEDIILYLFFGVLTTVVNIVVYYVCANLMGMYYLAANVCAWIAAVLFAYVTNRIWVFKSTANGLQAILKELILFTGCRVLSGVMDMGIMFFMVSLVHIDDMIAKLVCQVLVTIANYVFSKLIIFKKQEPNS
ncbi:MAG: GtrA family protein [Lachnospiraceae bacterium]